MKLLLLSMGFLAAQASLASQGTEPVAKPPHHVHHFSGSGPSGYSVTQIKHAYEVDKVSATGSGQTIAIVNAFGNPKVQNDLNVFSAQFGIPTTKIQVYYPGGKPKRIDATWALETSLDTQWAHAIAPGAKLILVVAKTATYTDLFKAIDYAVALGATQVSMSWGSVEWSGETDYDFHFNTPKAAFFASSGDGGAGVSWPAASPFVTSVGGTSLYLDSSGNRTQPETAWSGSGGGESVYEIQPTFQNQAQSTGHRTVPDVSYDADPSTGFPVYDSYGYQGLVGWIQIGGTSAGSPQWAALDAIANSQRSSLLGSLNSALYYLANPTNLSTYFDDISSGCNGSPSPTTCAQSGYDLVTGLGTPLALPLINSLGSI